MKELIERFDDAGDYAISSALLSEQGRKDYALHGYRSGVALVYKKKELQHGEFVGWCEENMPISYKHCQSYMRVAKQVGLEPEDKKNATFFLEQNSIIAIENMYLTEQSKIRMAKAAEKAKPTEKEKITKAEEKKAETEKLERMKEKIKEHVKKDDAPTFQLPERFVDPYPILLEIMKISGMDLQKQVFRVMRSYLHPDKETGNQDLFNKIQKLERYFK